MSICIPSTLAHGPDTPHTQARVCERKELFIPAGNREPVLEASDDRERERAFIQEGDRAPVLEASDAGRERERAFIQEGDRRQAMAERRSPDEGFWQSAAVS